MAPQHPRPSSSQQVSITSFFGANSQNPNKPVVSKKSHATKKRRRGSTFGQCPLCARSFPLHSLEQHAATCDGAKAKPTQITYLPHHREPIPGLFVFDNFITEQEEAQILAHLDGTDDDNDPTTVLPWKLANFNGPHYGMRWGVHCNLRDRKVSAPESVQNTR